MISIQAFMLIVLGFLIAALIGLLVVPAYRRRTERLAIEKIKRAMPLTEAEIRADKDRLRADYALVIHELEQGFEKATLAAARQRVEINRRDAIISGLEDEVGQLRTSLEGHENARRVLEQTIMDRLPKVEERLAEARKLLIQRDREVATLSQTAQKQARALEDASQLNMQTRDEVHRLTAALNVRSSRNRGLRGPDIEDEVALRTELEALRAKVRDQSGRITELEVLLAGADDSVPEADMDIRDRKDHRAEVVRLRGELSEAEAALRSAQSAVEASRRGRAQFEAETQSLKAKAEDQSAEITRLRAGLAAYQAAEKDHKSLAQSKLAMHSKIASLQAQTEDQEQKILSLKAEVAAANERMALQASHYTDELRQLSTRTTPAAGASLRDAMLRNGDTDKRRSLTERIGGSDRGAGQRVNEGEKDKPQARSDAANPTQMSEATDASRRTDYLRERVGELRPRVERETAEVSISRNERSSKPQAAAAGELNEERITAPKDGAHDETTAKRSPSGLLERITRLDRAE